MNRHLLLSLVAASVVLAACDDQKPPPRMAQANMFASDANRPMPMPTAPPPGARADQATPTSGSIHIDDKILRACGDIPIAHFAFDSSAVQPDAAVALDALARCFATGPLAGRNMLLTGHTDPRGETEYNLALGHRRAGSVATYLEGRGVARGHIGTTSHGEFDATGMDEAGWAKDRKVDVSLAD